MGEPKVKDAWSEVGKEFAGLGERLKGHFSSSGGSAQDAASETAESAESAEAATATATATADASGANGGEEAAGGSDAGAADALKSALKHLGEALDGVVEAIGGAAKDPAVVEDVRHVGQSLVNALSVTFQDAGGEIRKAFNRNRPGESEAETDATTTSSATTVSDPPEVSNGGSAPPSQPSGE